ncbi:hypothetical protein SLE2022_048110 [Rubroshorea leprosula]
MGRPIPDPPQLLHAIRPDPAQVRHPTSPSDHREHRQATLPVPLHVGHLGIGPAMGFWSITDLTRTAPANTLKPVAKTTGPMSPPLRIPPKRSRKPKDVEEKRK